MPHRMWWLLPAVLAGGCAMQKVEPWDRELLARPEMSFSGSSTEDEIRGRTFNAKEGSGGAGGGLTSVGCGCN